MDVKQNQVTDKDGALWQGEGIPKTETATEMPTRDQLWDTNKRLKRMYDTARDEIERLEAIMNPTVRHQTVIDCTDQKQSEMESAGWEIVHRQFMQNGPMKIVLCVVFRKPIDDQPPTPPKRLVVAEQSPLEKRVSPVLSDEADEVPPAARKVIEDVIVIPTMHLRRGFHPDLPTFDKQELNQIAGQKAWGRVMAVLNGESAS